VIRKKSASNWRYCLKASFFEIYNDQVRDLLVSVPRPPAADGEDTFFVDDEAASTVSSNPNASTDVNNLRVSLAANGQVFVAGATIVPVFCADHVYSLIHYANANRSVAATAMNARSSRSHSVFQLHIQARFLGLPGKPSDGSTLSSTISLVDLAGSERLDKSKTNSSGRTNEHALKETQHINASLSSLTKCIQAIARKSEHVPYRDSKLTYLLKDSLGGTAKTLFFTNVAAEADHLSESLCTLRFAETLKNVELGSRLVNKGGQNKIKK
jgi:kinesin family protein C2/C3